MKYRPFIHQQDFHLSEARIRALFAGKRGGKTQAGAIEAIRFAESNPGSHGAVIAPTHDMLRRLSIQTVLDWGKPFNFSYNKSFQEIDWPNGSKIYGISGEKPQRMEGLKLNWVWIDEALQCSEHLFLESMARVSDTKGYIWITSSLGVQYNPKQHWAYKHFVESPLDGSETFTWATVDNPYFPKEELIRLRNTLDAKTYKQMFTIDWEAPANNLVYEEFDDANIKNDHVYNPAYPVYVCIDWGWTNEMACLFFQMEGDRVILFDEIVRSKMTLEELYGRILDKKYNIKEWFCDSAGAQTREQSGISNVAWFRRRDVHFKYRNTAISYGIPIVRSYIRNGLGQVKFYIDAKCKKSIDQIRNYHYPEKQGVVDEVPKKQHDHCCDAIRYFFVNKLDDRRHKEQYKEVDRWQLMKF